MAWKQLTISLSTLCFVKEMRPSEPFLSLYLEENKNFTFEDIRQEIYPWWTYSSLVWIIPVFLLADFFRYKPVIIVINAAAVGSWALLLWAEGEVAMRFAQVLNGIFTAGELVYYFYIFIEIPKEHLKNVSLYIRAATICGKLFSFVTTQFLYSFCVADLYGLNWSSFIGVCGALFISFLLPWTKHSEIFHRVSYSIPKGPTPSDNAEMETDVSDLNDSGYQDYMEKDKLMISGDKLHHSSNEPGYRYKLLYMWTGLKYVYRNEGVFVWSIWWALATCGNFRIYYYVQNYWGSIISDDTECHDLIYNGAVEAISSLFGTIAIFLTLCAPVKWSTRSEMVMSVLCACNAAFLILMMEHKNIWLAYVMYVLFRTSHIIIVTIATIQVTLHLERQLYAVVFGCNMFVSLLIESVITFLVADRAGIGLGLKDQFTVYGVYFGTISVVFLFANMIRCFGQNKNNYDDIDSSETQLCSYSPLLQNVR